MKILLLQGPNLNRLGARPSGLYGSLTLTELHARLEERARELGCQLLPFQSNHEGALIDFLQEHQGSGDGVILNPGALTHYGLSLRDAVAECSLPVIEVHLSNIHARESWRRRSVFGDVVRAQVAGLGWRGYLAALEALVAMIREESGEG